MVAGEVLLDSEGFYGPYSTHELGVNSTIGFQDRKEGSKRQAQGPYACEICNNKFYDKQHELKHMKKHIKPLACKSEGCEHRFAEQRDLGRHEQVYHSSQKHLFKCDECLKDFTRSDNLTRHQKKPCKR
ncbi:uncharacterized protein LY79DRAFT_288675 [Colletotrichum navitas]|uniref:C2H2-type domain-containing protein n=1 Tax=Colletotrichum navitas TaxID=681940 RepID=A0AAD8QB34_9PEZI|nr:uncharacterized protein LY79DRAFT_288675 [Colletotrichum navitas]KAK1598452.1 hypothetical protein LY79DRAFT_288675 [Colletotrichum navitas]